MVRRGPGSVVGIETGYGLDGPGIDCRWGRDFPQPSRPDLWPTQSFPGVKRPGRGVGHPPPSSAEAEGRVQLYIYSPSGRALFLGVLYLNSAYVCIFIQMRTCVRILSHFVIIRLLSRKTSIRTLVCHHEHQICQLSDPSP
jgi:hypothetical protein